MEATLDHEAENQECVAVDREAPQADQGHCGVACRSRLAVAQ